MSLVATFGEAGVALRDHLGHLATKTIEFRLRLRLPMSGKGPRQIDSKVFYPFAEQVLRDTQILDAYTTLTEWADKTKRPRL
jgi:hypothetical protein